MGIQTGEPVFREVLKGWKQGWRVQGRNIPERGFEDLTQVIDRGNIV